MAKRTKKLSKSVLKLEALEQRQLLAGISGSGQEVTPGGEGVENYILHPNGNKYDQVLMTGQTVSVTNDTGTVTRVSFMDLQGDIVQAEFSGKGTLTISLDDYSGPKEAEKYIQPGVKYVSGLATFTIEGSDSTTNFSVFSVGSKTAINQSLFDDTHVGGNHTADVARVTIVADTTNPNGSNFGGIRAGNAVFTADNGPVGITAANVQVQNKVVIGEINATGSATPTLIFGKASQFGDVQVAGGGLLSANGKAINNVDSYTFGLTLMAGEKSDGTADAAEATQSQLSFLGNNPVAAQTKTFELTTGVDTIVGTTGGDKILASDTTITGLDTVNGGDGNDTLTVNDVAGASANLSLLTVSNVENLVVNSTKGLNGAALNTTAWTGLNSVVLTLNAGAAQTITASSTTDLSVVNTSAQDVSIIGGGQSLIVQNGAGAINVGQTNVANAYTSAEIKGGTTVAIRDYSKSGGGVGATLTSVTLDGNTGAATLTSDGLTSVTLKNLSTDTTITNTKDHALTVGLEKTAAGATLTDAKATSVSVSAAADSTLTTLTAAAAKSVSLAGTAGKLTVTTADVDAAETISITGSKDVTVGLGATAALKTIDASAATGPVKVTTAIGTGIVYKGGAGADTITLGATTKDITTGAGDDVVTVNASAITGTIDAGEGTDTLAMTSANAVTASASTTFEGKISGFERLDLGTFTTASAEVKLNNLDDINYVTVNGITSATAATADTLTLSGLANGATLKITGAADEAANDGYALALTDNSGSNDSVNLVISNVAGINVGKVDASGIETININSDDTASTPSGIAHTVALTAAAAKTIVVTGDAGLTVTGTGTALTSFDASAVSKGAVTLTTAALANAATLKGGAGNDVINASAATKAVTIEGGAGADTLTGSATAANTINGGDGNDIIVGGAAADTINGGAGNDTITTGGGLDMITGGAGNDTFIISVPANGNTYATITDASAGDKLQFADQGTETFTSAKVELASTAAFQDYLDAAAAATNAAANGNYSWFQYNGDTYLVQDNSDASTFQNGADIVVKLSGLVDLSKATGGTTNILTIA